jgi:hypothetical protein
MPQTESLGETELHSWLLANNVHSSQASLYIESLNVNRREIGKKGEKRD